MENERILYENIPKEKFEFVARDGSMHDKKFETKPVGYFRDAFRRFKKNKGSVVAAIIIGLLVLYAIIGPFCVNGNYQNITATDQYQKYYYHLTPRLSVFDGSGFWDGTQKKEISSGLYGRYEAMAEETGYNPVTKYISSRTTTDLFGNTSTLYKVRLNSYYSVLPIETQITYEEYINIQKWQDEHGKQVILPYSKNKVSRTLTDVWYRTDAKGRTGANVKDPDDNDTLDAEGNRIPDYYTTGEDNYVSEMRLANDPYNNGDTEGRWRYADPGSVASGNYNVRLNAYTFFEYQYGFKPSFAFGTDSRGFDIFSRLAKGARFSFLLAICISLINLTIGAIYGAIEGYYGGAIDLVMERISDILNGVPFIVVTVLFQLHLASKVGVVGSLIYAFILTGWIGMASRTRMQFYRFKNQEYVLAARTLGARDARIMFKHIFPNSLGTLITGSVLVIPGVIFSETSLSYLGVVNLDSATRSSIGSMLTAGQSVMTSAPHVVLFPAIFIALLMICFNLFGNGLRDAFNPSLRGSED